MAWLVQMSYFSCFAAKNHINVGNLCLCGGGRSQHHTTLHPDPVLMPVWPPICIQSRHSVSSVLWCQPMCFQCLFHSCCLRFSWAGAKSKLCRCRDTHSPPISFQLRRYEVLHLQNGMLHSQLASRIPNFEVRCCACFHPCGLLGYGMSLVVFQEKQQQPSDEPARPGFACSHSRMYCDNRGFVAILKKPCHSAASTYHENLLAFREQSPLWKVSPFPATLLRQYVRLHPHQTEAHNLCMGYWNGSTSTLFSETCQGLRLLA